MFADLDTDYADRMSDEDSLALLGVGIEYQPSRTGLSVRVEYNAMSNDRDAEKLSLQLGYNF